MHGRCLECHREWQAIQTFLSKGNSWTCLTCSFNKTGPHATAHETVAQLGDTTIDALEATINKAQ